MYRALCIVLSIYSLLHIFKFQLAMNFIATSEGLCSVSYNFMERTCIFTIHSNISYEIYFTITDAIITLLSYLAFVKDILPVTRVSVQCEGTLLAHSTPDTQLPHLHWVARLAAVDVKVWPLLASIHRLCANKNSSIKSDIISLLFIYMPDIK